MMISRFLLEHAVVFADLAIGLAAGLVIGYALGRRAARRTIVKRMDEIEREVWNKVCTRPFGHANDPTSPCNGIRRTEIWGCVSPWMPLQ